jgi:hypothetical protein
MVVLAILAMPIIISVSYAQTSSDAPASNNPPDQKREHIVKITSPSKGTQVTIGKTLTISGTSSDNTTNDCLVSVIVDGIKPYQNATGNGVGGIKDYSKWSFVVAPSYAAIKQGQNKITARFSCTNDPTFVTHNSVNVTGVSFAAIPASSEDRQLATNTSATALLKNASIGSSAPVNPSTGQNVTTASTKGSTNATSNETFRAGSNLSTESGYGNTANNVMSVSIHISKKSVQPGDEQTVSVKVINANSSSAISGATVIGSITYPSGGSFKKLGGTTDSTGKSSYSWTVGQKDATGKYKTVLDVSAPGYENSTASKTFLVVPVTSTSNSDTNQFPNFSTGGHHSNSPSTIIPIPHIRIPIIKIPFHLPFH